MLAPVPGAQRCNPSGLPDRDAEGAAWQVNSPSRTSSRVAPPAPTTPAVKAVSSIGIPAVGVPAAEEGVKAGMDVERDALETVSTQKKGAVPVIGIDGKEAQVVEATASAMDIDTVSVVPTGRTKFAYWFTHAKPLKLAAPSVEVWKEHRAAWTFAFVRSTKIYRPEVATDSMNALDTAGSHILFGNMSVDHFANTPLGRWFCYYCINVDAFPVPPTFELQQYLVDGEILGLCEMCWAGKPKASGRSDCDHLVEGSEAATRKSIIAKDYELQLYGWVLTVLADEEARRKLSARPPTPQDTRVAYVVSTIAVPNDHAAVTAMPFSEEVNARRELHDLYDQMRGGEGGLDAGIALIQRELEKRDSHWKGKVAEALTLREEIKRLRAEMAPREVRVIPSIHGRQ